MTPLALLAASAWSQAPALNVSPSVVRLDPVPVGTDLPVVLRFTDDLAQGVSVTNLSLTNTSGTAFGVDGALGVTIPSGGTGELTLRYAPTAVGPHAATLTWSVDDSCSPTSVELRGSAFLPCVRATPSPLDFGDVSPSSPKTAQLHLESCDGGTWTIDQTPIPDNSRFIVVNQAPIQIPPTGTTVTFQFDPTDDSPASATVSLGSWDTTVRLIANDCENGDPAIWDANGDGTLDCGTEPVADWRDADGDGYTPADGDCNDLDPNANPGQAEVDGPTDDDCDGRVDEHLDPDGDNVREPQDCDQSDPFANVGEAEILDDVDNDCDGEVDEGFEELCAQGDPAGDSGGCGCATPGHGPTPWFLAPLLLLPVRRWSRRAPDGMHAASRGRPCDAHCSPCSSSPPA